MNETVYRSFFKAISYRLLSTMITSVIILGVTGEGRIAVAVGVADSIIKIFTYYAHERAWTFIGFGTREISSEKFALNVPITETQE